MIVAACVPGRGADQNDVAARRVAQVDLVIPTNSIGYQIRRTTDEHDIVAISADYRHRRSGYWRLANQSGRWRCNGTRSAYLRAVASDKSQRTIRRAHLYKIRNLHFGERT